MKLGVALAAMIAAGTAPAAANDSSAELSLGGLTFTKSADVSMESEELRITPETVTVKYRFLNQSAAPVTLTVGFPLPDLDLADIDGVAIPNADAANFVGFQTKIDGKPAEFKIDQRAFVGDNDVTAQLKELKLPLLSLNGLAGQLKALPEAVRTKLVDQGVLVQVGLNDRNQPIYGAGWKVRTTVLRQQTFPSKQPVSVEHTYKTSLGASIDTVLRKALRQDKGMAKEIERYRRDFCVTDAFLAGVDKIAGDGGMNPEKLQERRISYVLKTGANWAGPIKQFHLVVDSGKPGRLVSFCAPGEIKTTSPTTFEVSATNFTPTQDLRILMLGPF